MEVVTDFSAANEIKFSFSGTYTPGSLYTPNHYTFILKGCSIVKYTTAVNLPDGRKFISNFRKSNLCIQQKLLSSTWNFRWHIIAR